MGNLPSTVRSFDSFLASNHFTGISYVRMALS